MRNWSVWHFGFKIWVGIETEQMHSPPLCPSTSKMTVKQKPERIQLEAFKEVWKVEGGWWGTTNRRLQMLSSGTSSQRHRKQVKPHQEDIERSRKQGWAVGGAETWGLDKSLHKKQSPNHLPHTTPPDEHQGPWGVEDWNPTSCQLNQKGPGHRDQKSLSNAGP